MTVFPGDPDVRIDPALTIERDGVNVLRLHIGSQTGTHVDAPSHVLPEGKALHELPLDRFVGRAVVADLRQAGPNDAITWQDLSPVRDALGEGAVLLLCTGWSEHFGEYPRYRSHPWLDRDAARHIVGSGVRTIGIDALSVDATPEDLAEIAFDAHREILGVDGVIVENLTNLAQVLRLRDPIVSVLPLNLLGSDGAPVRAVAYDAPS